MRPPLPRFAQQIWPTDLTSTLLVVVFAWTTFVGLGYTVLLLATFQKNSAYLPLTIPIALIGAVGLWPRASRWMLVPNSLVWLGFLASSLAGGFQYWFGTLASSAELAVTVFIAYRLLLANRRQGRSYEAWVNGLGWDLYELSKVPLFTDESSEAVRVCRAVRVGEVERHFDQTTSASIQGQMRHTFNTWGTSSSLHGVPNLLSDTQSWSSSQGTGESTVQLVQDGVSSDDLTSDAFVAVFEQTLSSGEVDTVRAIVPSEQQARAYVAQMLSSWASQLGHGSEPELMLRRYVGAITNGVVSESSYVGDRLGAIARLAPADRAVVTVIGQPVGEHAILAGAIRFGSEGPLYPLFPVALVRALAALMSGRRLPKPPSGLPPASIRPADEEVDIDQVVATPEPANANGHMSLLTVRTIGGLRLAQGKDNLTSTLSDRKVLAFLWLYLLARRLRSPHDSITRASLADELSPGLDSATQRSRLRGRLSELRNQLPAAIGKRVEVSGDRISLNLTDCDIDLLRLLEASPLYGGAKGVLSSDQLANIESLLTGSEGIFLPDWEDLEQHVNGARGGAGEVVAELRRRVVAAQASLLKALGEGHLAHANPAAATVSLERALALIPDDEPVARSLVSACLQSGRLTRAEELRKEFSLV
jgi:DNA-binding SARP family transcriptional activator